MRSLFLFIIFGACLTAQQAAIEGTVLDAVTRQPMPGVHITMRPLTPPEEPASENVYGALSDKDGHFSIAAMQTAIYSLIAQRNGYFHLPPRAPNGRTDDSVTLKPGDRLTDFTVEMTPEAVISGTVLDEYGDPVHHVQVDALPAPGSQTAMTPFGLHGSTDDRGQFRIALPPGRFYVKAAAANMRPMFIQTEIRNGSLGASLYGDTYYPGTESKEQATPVALTAGRQATGIDIRLARKRTLTISGIVTGIPDRSAPVYVLIFSGDNPGGTVVLDAAPDGKFTVARPPGSYRLQARTDSSGAALRSSYVEVRLDSADRDNVSLALVPGETLSGSLSIEGNAPAEKLNVRLDRYTTYGAPEPASLVKGGEVDRDGSFRLDPVFPDKFRVRVFPMPENAYIKSVKLDDAEAPDGILDLSRGVGGARVTLTISRNGGQIEGTLLSNSVAFVVLAATVDEVRGDNFKFISPGEKFRYTGLRPGKYRLIAMDARQFAGEFETVKELFPKAPEIEIREGDRITKDVKVLDPENPSAKP